MSSFPTTARRDSTGSQRTNRLWTICFGLLILAAPARFSQGQQPDDADDPARAVVTDDEETSSAEEEPMVTPPEDPMPEVPETTVVGRPSPFPATPLGEGTVLSASRSETFSSQVGSSLTVITEEQLTRTRQGRLTEVLRGVPGLDIVQRGGPGQQSSVFLRGAESRHTKVLVDGIPVNDASQPQRGFDFSLLSVDNIQQIEVLRGPQSTLWGSDAIGGVINIVTKRGEGPTTVQAGLEGGSFGTSRETLSISGGTPCYHYSLGASYQKAAGFSTAAVGTENDRFSGATYSGRVGWTPTDNFDIDYSFRYVDQVLDLDDFDFIAGTMVDHLLLQQHGLAFFNRVQARLATLDGLWEHRVAFNLADHDRRSINAPVFWTPQFEGQTRKFEYLSVFDLGENQTLTAGFDYWHEDATDTNIPSFAQHMAGIYVHDEIRLYDRWFTTLGFRFDDHSRAGTAETYRIASLFKLYETGTSFHGSIGTGFRAPTVTELFHPIFGGNLNLTPERSFGWDCGLEQQFFCGALVVDGTYFRNDFDDLIQWVFPAGYSNVRQAFSSGVELTARLELDPCTTLYGTYVHTLAKDLQTDTDLLLRPRHKASFTVNRRLDPCSDKANMYLSLLYVGPRSDFGGARLSEYYLMNLAGSYRLNDTCEFFARVDNVLDENYQEVAGFGTAPISFFGGVNLRY